jgi:hypothetical protein
MKRLTLSSPKTIFIVMVILLMNIQTKAQKDTINDYYNLSLAELMNIKVSSASKTEQKQSEAPNIISLIKREDRKSVV